MLKISVMCTHIPKSVFVCIHIYLCEILDSSVNIFLNEYHVT